MGVAIRQGICDQCMYCYKPSKVKSDKRYTCGCADSKMFDKIFENPKQRGCVHCFLPRAVGCDGAE